MCRVCFIGTTYYVQYILYNLCIDVMGRVRCTRGQQLLADVVLSINDTPRSGEVSDPSGHHYGHRLIGQDMQSRVNRL